MSPEEVCDAVFGRETKDGPSLRSDCNIKSSIRGPWAYWFDATIEAPEWYPDFQRHG